MPDYVLTPYYGEGQISAEAAQAGETALRRWQRNILRRMLARDGALGWERLIDRTLDYSTIRYLSINPWRN